MSLWSRLPFTELGPFELAVLEAVKNLDDAYAVTIGKRIQPAFRKRIKLGRIYTALDRLEDEGYITSWMSPGTPERGGYAKCSWRIEAEGEAVLRISVASPSLDGAVGLREVSR